ncbi:MAG: radical SAM protein [Candidatus Omnitrophica bacterium]|nr:radical SAM protein [Candidatus Omnitrophota bacterium]MDD5429599.1 radical SAM protein [Candidatus Omnitrophota bacterium]
MIVYQLKKYFLRILGFIIKKLDYPLYLAKKNTSNKWKKKYGGEFRIGMDDPVLSILFDITSRCNYNCEYCSSSQVRNKKRHILRCRDAFQYYSVEKWVEAFRLVEFEYTLTISGGELFVLGENFHNFLKGVAALDNVKLITICTNGALITKMEQLDEKVREKTTLMVSYHPTQISKESYVEAIDDVCCRGWHIGMFVYVMEANQVDQYEDAKKMLTDRYAVGLLANPDVKNNCKQQKLKACGKYISRKDLFQKVGSTTFGKFCFFPAIAYELSATGIAYRGCTGKGKTNFIHNSKSLYPLKRPVPCPLPVCYCLNKYAFLEDFSERGRELDLVGEYAKKEKNIVNEM